MSRHDNKGNLQKQDIERLLNSILPVLENSNISYCLIGGVLDDIIELKDISGPHHDIDFYLFQPDAPAVKQLMDSELSSCGSLNKAKLQYVLSNSPNEYSVEFILLCEDPANDTQYQSATTDDFSNVKRFPKNFVNPISSINLSNIIAPIRLPAKPAELMQILKT